MNDLSERQIIEFLYRSYVAADGLWFMKVEERFGFDEALDIDRMVWSVVPKIQARLLRSMTGGGNDMESLKTCVQAKMRIEGFAFATNADPGGFTVTISRCPWHDLRIKSQRGHLSAAIGDAVCTAEFSVFAAEFGQGFRFARRAGLCKGAVHCLLGFRSSKTTHDD